ncbi:MAG TPA: hypothetical protein VNH44_11950 [Micropepsaceae bacterium]|nr:hypothetical protein [Micropepsaceae bacterium]
MLSHNSVTEHIQLLRSRVARYRILAETLYDQQIAAEIAGFAAELEDELVRLEHRQHSYGVGKIAAAAFAS